MRITVPRKFEVPGAALVDERITLLDVRLMGYLFTLEQNGWHKENPDEIAQALGKSRAMVHQRLVKLCTWGYVERRGEAKAWEWRIKLDPDDESVARAVTSSPEHKTSTKSTSGDEITSKKAELVTKSPVGEQITSTGDEITKKDRESISLVTGSPAGDEITPPKRNNQNPQVGVGSAGGGARERVLQIIRDNAGPGLASFDQEPQLLLSATIIPHWLSEGIDPDEDIGPVVAALTAEPRSQPIKLLRYFTPALRRHRDERLNPPARETRNVQRSRVDIGAMVERIRSEG